MKDTIGYPMSSGQTWKYTYKYIIQTEQIIFRNIYDILYILIYYALQIIYYVIYVCNKINTKSDHKFEREQEG